MALPSSLIFQLRDAIANMIATEFQKRNLLPRYALAKGTIDHSSRTIQVLMNGTEDAPENYVTVAMNTVHPTAVGDVLRIEGSGSDQYVSEVITQNKIYLRVGTVETVDGIKAVTLPVIAGGVAVVYEPATGRLGRAS
jgi:hypothetical protein